MPDSPTFLFKKDFGPRPWSLICLPCEPPPPEWMDVMTFYEMVLYWYSRRDLDWWKNMRLAHWPGGVLNFSSLGMSSLITLSDSWICINCKRRFGFSAAIRGARCPVRLNRAQGVSVSDQGRMRRRCGYHLRKLRHSGIACPEHLDFGNQSGVICILTDNPLLWDACLASS